MYSSTAMTDENTNHIGTTESAPKRRSILRSIGAGLTVAVGFGGVATAEPTNRQASTEVERVDVDVDAALQKLDDVINSPLFEALVSEGHISEQSINSFPSHQLDDDSRPGGITRLRVNDELEQLNFHKVMGDEKLEVNLPLSDNEPKAVLHRREDSEIVYHAGNQFQGEDVSEISANSSVGPTEDCSGFRYCTTCVACCGYDNWSRNEEKVDCPNCVVTDCQWVKIGCC